MPHHRASRLGGDPYQSTARLPAVKRPAAGPSAPDARRPSAMREIPSLDNSSFFHGWTDNCKNSGASVGKSFPIPKSLEKNGYTCHRIIPGGSSCVSTAFAPSPVGRIPIVRGRPFPREFAGIAFPGPPSWRSHPRSTILEDNTLTFTGFREWSIMNKSRKKKVFRPGGYDPLEERVVLSPGGAGELAEELRERGRRRASRRPERRQLPGQALRSPGPAGSSPVPAARAEGGANGAGLRRQQPGGQPDGDLAGLQGPDRHGRRAHGHEHGELRESAPTSSPTRAASSTRAST